MNADTHELKTILTLERRYIIPTFQRDYEWTEKGQWALLFEDLEAVADRLEDARRTAVAAGKPIAKAEKTVAPHFLGAIVLDLLPSSAGSLDMRAVIDGQQRLTTMQLLVRGMLDILIELKSSRVPQVRRLIQNPDDVIQNTDDRYKLWPRRRDRDSWRSVMGDALPQSDHLYSKARRFFADRFRAISIAPDGSDRSDVVVDALLGLFKLVVIDLEDNDDAQVIFEVLNGRQTPLTATDLVKNLLFLRAELHDEASLEALYDKHWARFDDPWWREEIGRGHAARQRRDVLLSNWLTAASETEVNVGHLYGEVRRFIDAQSPPIENLLEDISGFAEAFRQVSSPSSVASPRMADVYRRIDRLGVTTALPLLAWLRTLPQAVLSETDHLRAAVAIDSWIVRRFIAGWNTRGYGKRFLDVLKAAKAAERAGSSIVLAIENSLMTTAADNLAWPGDQDVEAAFREREFYNSASQERIRMLLGAIDAQMHAEHPKGEKPTFNYDVLHIEHLLPQAWQSNWPVSADSESQRSVREQQRERAKNRLGNLTLLTAPLNSSVSNGKWFDKRPEIAKHSNLRLNAMFTKPIDWNEPAIDARAKELAGVACRIWPRPAALPT
jgi:hypothetical protein